MEEIEDRYNNRWDFITRDGWIVIGMSLFIVLIILLTE